jgi:hypothetical protein
MKLLLRRDQRAGGMLGNKVIFVLHVRADIAPEEKEAISKYKLGDCMLYARERLRLEEESLKGAAKFWLKHMLNLTVQVRDLVEGKTIECKDIMEMLAVEEQLKEAAEAFGMMLRAAMHFGGEEVVEV